MPYPKLYRDLFQDDGAGDKLNESIIPESVANKDEVAAVQTEVAAIPRPNSYVTETWVSKDQNNWYRKWSDGFIEQGGYATKTRRDISLLTPFSTANYTVICQIDTVSEGSTATGFIQVCIKDKTTFYIRCKSLGDKLYSDPAWWVAYGY